ncbi:hypothetical protein KVA01_18880 [Kocuria varians]|uniref:DUF998 domain-containing protein n=1 Tax=Kocuria varians TaxID=1272 RepID=A0A4Y4D821_KOCVA|nr:DUF998 domain-containing protein [Kocuria varians]GEC99733.1 hypothetical protein KVA01_18880 [Kocuria varians]
MTLASRRLCLAVAVIYSAWLVAPLLDPWTSYASEYFVADRPAASLLRTADGLAGVLLVVIAVLSYARVRTLWRGLPGGPAPAACGGGTTTSSGTPGATSRRGRVAVRTWAASLAFAGLATVVDAINPMTCAPSISPVCHAAEEAGTLPVQHQLHTVSSALVGVALIVAMLASLVLSTRADRVVRIASWAGIVTIALSGIDALVTRIPTEGITQRISMIAIVVWLVAAAGLPVVDRLRAGSRAAAS